jgi:hypothetical protein
MNYPLISRDKMSDNKLRSKLRALEANLKAELAKKCPRVEAIVIVFHEITTLVERDDPSCKDLHCSGLMKQIVYTVLA